MKPPCVYDGSYVSLGQGIVWAKKLITAKNAAIFAADTHLWRAFWHYLLSRQGTA